MHVADYTFEVVFKFEVRKDSKSVFGICRVQQFSEFICFTDCVRFFIDLTLSERQNTFFAQPLGDDLYGRRATPHLLSVGVVNCALFIAKG